MENLDELRSYYTHCWKDFFVVPNRESLLQGFDNCISRNIGRNHPR